MVDWHPIMRRVAQHAQTHSPDPSSQNAACIVRNGATCGWSVNQFPRHVAYTDERWERPTKYSYIEHAERNAVYWAARHGISADGATMVALWAACPDCGRALIQSGIKRLVTMRPTSDGAHAGWDDGIQLAMGMLQEAGVAVEYLDGPLGITILRNGNEITV